LPATADGSSLLELCRELAYRMLAHCNFCAWELALIESNAPMLWNSNFFITLESMKILRVLTDVWLPDFKFGPGRCAMALTKTPWYWETVTRNLALIAEWSEDFSIRHLVMPNHVECCTYPVLEWIAEHMPAVPVFHPDNFCDSASAKYRDRYAEIARRPSRTELNMSWRRARELGLKFESTTFERATTHWA
jgi:putative pyruvate formate lyase activating enzyme